MCCTFHFTQYTKQGQTLSPLCLMRCWYDSCRSGTSVLRQLYFAVLDLTLHSQYFPKQGQFVENTQLFKDVVNKTTVMPPIPGDR